MTAEKLEYSSWIGAAKDYAKKITDKWEPPLPDDEFKDGFQFDESCWWRPLWAQGLSPEEAVREEMSYWEIEP